MGDVSETTSVDPPSLSDSEKANTEAKLEERTIAKTKLAAGMDETLKSLLQISSEYVTDVYTTQWQVREEINACLANLKDIEGSRKQTEAAEEKATQYVLLHARVEDVAIKLDDMMHRLAALAAAIEEYNGS
eukprot:Clim_evm11s23 gene=Clim_evmTU11s23